MSFYKTEKCFRRYEKVITEAVLQWPKPVRFKTDRSLQTDAARCRDAISAFKVNHWATAHDPEVFHPLKSGQITLKVWIENDFVMVGHRDNLNRAADASNFDDDVAYAQQADSFGAIKFSPTDSSHIDHILFLIEYAIIDFPVAIDLSWQPVVEEKISDLLNVVMKPDETTNKLYLL